MIITCDNSYIPIVKEYLGEDKWKCFYLYADMMKYGACGSNYGLWLFKNRGEICAVAYRYYNTIHFYSRYQIVENEMMKLIRDVSPACITGSQEFIGQMKLHLKDSYKEEFQHIITTDHLLKEFKMFPCEKASETDVYELAEIMMRDDIFSRLYTYEDLCRQMSDGIRDGSRRIYVIRDNGRILASCSIYVETSEAGMIGSLVADKASGFGLGPVIATYVWNLLYKEGKRGIAFVNVDNHNAIAMYQKLGLDFIGLTARLLKS